MHIGYFQIGKTAGHYSDKLVCYCTDLVIRRKGIYSKLLYADISDDTLRRLCEQTADPSLWRIPPDLLCAIWDRCIELGYID